MLPQEGFATGELKGRATTLHSESNMDFQHINCGETVIQCLLVLLCLSVSQYTVVHPICGHDTCHSLCKI